MFSLTYGPMCAHRAGTRGRFYAIHAGDVSPEIPLSPSPWHLLLVQFLKKDSLFVCR
jgi:hypothetical protein